MNYYEEQVKKAREKYDLSVEKLQKLKEDIGYETLEGEKLYELIRQNQLLEQAKALPYLKKMTFANIGEFSAFYRRAAEIVEKRDEMTQVCASIYAISKNIDFVNNFVKDNPFLSDALVLPKNELFEEQAKKFLETANDGLTRLLGKEFRTALLHAAVRSLSGQDLVTLAKDGIILPDDLPVLETGADDNGYFKLRSVYAAFEAEPPETETMQTKLKGVSFHNDDGTSRQAYLKELALLPPGERLTVEFYTFYRDNVPEPAARVFWGKKELGSLPKELAKQLSDKYSSMRVSATVVHAGGDETHPYGCSVELSVSGKKKVNPVLADAFAQLAAHIGKKETPKKAKASEIAIPIPSAEIDQEIPEPEIA